jgi:hypothetical protein
MKNSIGRRNSEGYSDPTAYHALNAILNDVKESTKAAKPNRPTVNYHPLVYICSPFAGDMAANKRRARGYCRFAVEHGAVPIAPHLLFPQFMDEQVEAERVMALKMGLLLLNKCNELWYFGSNISPGMKSEIRHAISQGTRIRQFTEGCQEVVK